jgi:hypothetical protein
LSWQSRWAGDSQNPRLEIVLGLAAATVVVGLLVVWAMTRDAPPPSTEPSVADLEVVTAEVRVAAVPDRRRVAVVGEVVNHGELGRKNVFFQVECFDREDRRIDAFPARLYALVLPPGETTRFKLIEDDPLAASETYERCEVEVRWADVIK